MMRLSSWVSIWVTEADSSRPHACTKMDSIYMHSLILFKSKLHLVFREEGAKALTHPCPWNVGTNLPLSQAGNRGNPPLSTLELRQNFYSNREKVQSMRLHKETLNIGVNWDSCGCLYQWHSFKGLLRQRSKNLSVTPFSVVEEGRRICKG